MPETRKPVSTIPRPDPIELVKAELYTTTIGSGKQYTNVFYRSVDHNFGIECQVRNNSQNQQNIPIGIALYLGEEKKSNKTINVPLRPYSIGEEALYFNQEFCRTLECGCYTILLWVNEKKRKFSFYIKP